MKLPGKGQDKKKSYDLVLVQPPIWGINFPPMSLAYISQYLRDNGMKTRAFDLNISEYHRAEDKGYWLNEKAHLWMEEDTFSLVKKELNIDFPEIAKIMTKEETTAFGFSITSPTRTYSKELMKELKVVSDAKIILGGKGVFTHDERKYFKGFADYFVIGEGEESIYELIDGIKKGLSEEELSKIKGVISDKFPKNYRPRPAMDLKTKGFPDYKEFDFSRYAEKSLGIILSQGCIGSCYFCEDKGFQGHYRTRDPDIVAKEMIYHYKKNRIRKFWFNDLAINGDYKALEKLCDNIIKSRIKIRWIALAIARSDFPTELIYKMKKSGCYTLNFGIESGSDSMLKKMNKHMLFDVKGAERVIRDTWNAGINTQLNFIVGYPGETEDEFNETLDFIKRNKKYISGITNINTCVIPDTSPLASKKELYEFIDIPETPRGLAWKDEKLTLEIRKERANKAYELARELGFDIWFSNLCETN